MPDDPAMPAAAPTRPRDLFFAFNRLALQGFGGVLPVAQRELVERLGWLTRTEFVELMSAGQVLPGPNIVNVSLMYGDRCFGWRGALAACSGILLAPLAIVLALAVLYAQFVHLPWVVGSLRGMGAVAAGLVLSTGLKLMPTLRNNVLGRLPSLAVAALTVLATAAARLPLVLVILTLGVGSMALAAWHLRPRGDGA